MVDKIITKKLRETFKDCVTSNGDESVLSVAYLALLGRNGFTLYSEDDVHVIVCAHPNDPESVLVLPPISKDAQKAEESALLPSVLKDFANTDKEVRLSRFSQDQLARLREKLSIMPQDTISKVEAVPEDKLDWYHPCHILSTKSVAQLEGGEFKRVRKKLSALQSQHEITTECIHSSNMLNKMRYIMTRWEAKMILDDKADMGRDVVSVYETIFHSLEKNPSLYEGRVFFVDGAPSGLAIWDKNTQDNAVLLVNLNDHSVKDLSVYQIVETCRILDEAGVRYCDLGGSEDEGLNRFKESLRPERSIVLKSAVVQFNRPKMKPQDIIAWA